MIRSGLHIALLGILLTGCAGESSDDSIEDERDIEGQLGGTLYVNEYGSDRLIEENDSTMRTIFHNNEGYELDTVMKIQRDFKLTQDQDSLPFLALKGRGIQMHESYLEVFEFTSMDLLGALTKIPHLYDRPFYKTETEIKVEGDVLRGKGTTINGIWIEEFDDEGYDLPYAFAYGVIHKEKYPESFYSTDESPQGLFENVDQEHYRLIFEDADFESPPTFLYKGTAINISTGESAIVWEFAGSEAFILEGHEPWTNEEVGQEIEVEGYLVQDYTGSYLKNWKIFEFDPFKTIE